MSSPRYLTKSRYVTGLECPTKLFYTGKKKEYADQKFDDPFLQQLALGGFQIGELAKCYYPEGKEITPRDYDESLAQTAELLKQDKVTIFEAAFRHENLFVRADIVIKNGDTLDLIEVKSKSWSPADSSFVGKRGGIDANYRDKLDDITFQKYVIENAYPQFKVNASFMFVDKSSTCPTDGLHQKFRIVKEGDRKRCVVHGELTAEDLSPKILCTVPADDVCKMIEGEKDPYDGVRSFAEHIRFLADSYERDAKVAPRPSAACGGCEFRASAKERAAGLKSGHHECWTEALGWSIDEIDEPNILNLWDCRSKPKLIAEGKIRFSQLTEIDIGIKTDDKPGITRTERQWMQIEMARTRQTDHWIHREDLRSVMRDFRYPLHFIDFETSMPAIPFRKGRRPYEGIAFQFSHHVVHEDGRVEHAGEFLEAAPGTFPNYDFLRALRDELTTDNGTIFRYAAHENTYLNHIWEQLRSDDTVDDRDALCAFILSISKSKKDQLETWCGDRNMIDMLEMVKRFYYHPSTNGSNSIKHVLPSVINSSEYLKAKYSQPIYGAEGGIPSKNFKDWTWIVHEEADGGEIANRRSQIEMAEAIANRKSQIENRNCVDPYHLLEPPFQGATKHDLELLLSEEEDAAIREGGAAMAAYALLQFEDMTDYERYEIERSLKRYCELDTLAMVMIYEAWREWVR